MKPIHGAASRAFAVQLYEENKALREQNRVLREALEEIASDIKCNPKRKQMLADDDFWAAPGEHTLRQWIAKSALREATFFDQAPFRVFWGAWIRRG